MRLRVLHTTRYTYPTPASDSHNELRLMPLSDADQTCLDFRIGLAPEARLFAYDLPSGRVHHFSVRPPHMTLEIRAESLVVTHRANPLAALQLSVDDSAFYEREGVRQHFYDYLAPTPRVPLDPVTDRIAAVVRRHAGVGTASFLIGLTRLLHRVFTYAPDSASVNAVLRRVLDNRSLACQEFLHLMLAVCRRQRIPARCVSGYLCTLSLAPAQQPWGEDLSARADDGAGRERPAIVDRELIRCEAMHFWVECLLPDGQWRGFDPTNNLVADERFVKVHYGRDYDDVTPVRGVYRGPDPRAVDVVVEVRQELNR